MHRWQKLAGYVLAVMAACAALACVAYALRVRSIVHQRREFIANVMHRGEASMGTTSPGAVQRPLPFAWGGLGARPINAIVVPRHRYSQEELEPIRVLFPEADVYPDPIEDHILIYVQPMAYLPHN